MGTTRGPAEVQRLIIRQGRKIVFIACVGTVFKGELQVVFSVRQQVVEDEGTSGGCVQRHEAVAEQYHSVTLPERHAAVLRFCRSAVSELHSAEAEGWQVREYLERGPVDERVAASRCRDALRGCLERKGLPGSISDADATCRARLQVKLLPYDCFPPDRQGVEGGYFCCPHLDDVLDIQRLRICQAHESTAADVAPELADVFEAGHHLPVHAVD